MRQFNYNAIDEKGEEHKGFIEAIDQNMVLQQLRQRGLYVLQLQEDEVSLEQKEIAPDFWAELNAYAPVTTSQKVFFFKQLALMLRSGMSITEAFDIITKMQRGRMRQISLRINNSIKSGESFSKAMSQYNGVFSKLAVQMIHSAETSGELDVALMRIASYLEHKAELKKQVMSAMMYPAFTLLAAIGVFIFLLVYIIPKFQSFLENSGKKIPASTQAMIDLGSFFSGNWQVMMFMFISCVIGFIVFYKRPAGKLIVDRLVLSVPIVGPTITAAAMAQLSWGLGVLLRSGIPVVDSLRIISEMVSNSIIARNISKASDKVLHGQDLGTSFNQAFISSLIKQLMIVGERSGNLVQIMEEASLYYEDDLRSKTKALANAVEPISILLIGGIVGFVYYGFFKAVMAVSTGR
ncbi:MAG: general secretion pathway protein GspF [Thermodesulfobacteriota bacterium]|nr:MAG: general secretion pathway protein GspF [Thermodesulfobacteriota bacterium]